MLIKFINKLERIVSKWKSITKKNPSCFVGDAAIHFGSEEKWTHYGCNKTGAEDLPFWTWESHSKISRLYLRMMKVNRCSPYTGQLQRFAKGRKKQIWCTTQAAGFRVDNFTRDEWRCNTDRDSFMDGKHISRNFLSCICCCWDKETNSDVKITEISTFSSKFTPRRYNKYIFVEFMS